VAFCSEINNQVDLLSEERLPQGGSCGRLGLGRWLLGGMTNGQALGYPLIISPWELMRHLCIGAIIGISHRPPPCCLIHRALNKRALPLFEGFDRPRTAIYSR